MRIKRWLEAYLLSLGSPNLVKFVSVRPSASEIRVTENCNSRCMTCNAWKNRSVNELTTAEFKNVFFQLRQLGVDCVVFTGGEPLLRHDIGSIIREAKLVGFNEVMLITNGLLLEQKAPVLVESGLDRLLVSIDGMEATDERIKGIPTHFKRATQGIAIANRLAEKEKVDLKTVVLTTLMRPNAEEIPMLIDKCRSLGASWYFNLLESNIRFFRNTDMASLRIESQEAIDTLFDHLSDLQKSPSSRYFCYHQLNYARDYLKGKNRFIPCVHGYIRINIGAHGEVYSGCFVLEPMGNVREEKLSHIISTKRYRKRIERMYVRNCPGCTNLWGEQVISKHIVSHIFHCQGIRTALFPDLRQKQIATA